MLSSFRVLSRLLSSVALCLAVAPAFADSERMLWEDELVFSELECHSEEKSATPAYGIDKSRLIFPMAIQAEGTDGWIRIEVDGAPCWIAPDGYVVRSDDRPMSGGTTRRADKKNYAVVKVHYATNRKDTGNAEPDRRFLGGRGQMGYGTCEVSIPRDHRLGKLEQPSLWRFEFNPDPNSHVVLLNAQPQKLDEFMAGVRARVNQSKSRSLFVFVHGYNVNFADAARRTAQMTYDLGYDGAPILFSWPSQAKLSGYLEDENNSEWSIPDLQAFLENIAGEARDGEIYLVAHSMGNRVATRAVAQLLSEKPALRARFKEIMLIAPDVDVDIFKRDLAPVLLKGNTHVTLYASNKDKALQASQKLHGFSRLGEATPVTILKGMDTIDATEVATDLLGHSYYADTKHVLSDIFAVINEQRSVSLRALTEVLSLAGRYWKLQ